MGEEKVYFDNGTTKVTSSSVLAGADTYFIRNINSAKLRYQDIPWL